ncbi:MAG: glycosyltransferase family 2 protein [Armatimonadetes bacterium]|nr:glycosyltransferase family 2 protein [Armatimonadota bacterium]
MSTLPIAVVIVSYNTRELLRRCLGSLGSVSSVYVVDNASVDGSAEMVRSDFPSVHLIANSANVGFGRANNQALEVVKEPLVLLLNSDALAACCAIEQLSKVFDDPTVIAAGGALSYPDGSPQDSACSRLTLWRVFCEQTWIEKLFRNSRVLNGYWLNRWLPRDQASEVDQVMGACLMFRPVERFDPRYFLYCEDTELCIRLRKHGRILFEPRATFIHALGASSEGELRWKSISYYNRGKELTFAIHNGAISAVSCWFLNRFGALLRVFVYGMATLLTLGLYKASRGRLAVFVRVLFAPIFGP